MTMQEAGQTARSAITGLSASPVVLGLVLLQVFLLGGLTYLNVQRLNADNVRNAAVDARFRMMIDRCVPNYHGAEKDDRVEPPP